MQWDERERGFQRRGSKGAAEEKKNPRAQPGMAVPQDRRTLAGRMPALPGVFHAGLGGIRWRERDDRNECIDTSGE